MNRTKGSADTLFTIVTAVCGAALAFVFIAVGSMVARVTFTPHAEHPASHQAPH